METENGGFYWLMNYGRCTLDTCQCIAQKNPRYDGAWAGIVCPDWLPLGIRSLDEMIEAAKKAYKYEHKD
jgi:hypothetical protein